MWRKVGRSGATNDSVGVVTRASRYLPIRDYAAIGDGRTIALVGRDGTVDWLCLPDLDSPSVFAALVDADDGGHFALAPSVPYEAERRYQPATNVLETTFTTPCGTVRVSDAMTLPTHGLAPYRELVRRVDGVSGAVPMCWRVAPRFAYAQAPARFVARAGVPIAAHGGDALAVRAWDAGEIGIDSGGVRGDFVTGVGSASLISLSAAHHEPLVLPARADVEARLAATAARWRDWVGSRVYDGPWRDAVIRSALALKLLVSAPSGAIAAAATTSLPEEIGGTRNWDYRFSWPRDAAFTLRALLSLGCGGEAEAYFWWTLHASQLTHPRLQVLYGLNAGAGADEREVPLAGYRDSRPVRVGNGAAGQLQLDVYGELLDAAAVFARDRGRLDREHARRLADIADHVCASWRERDAGIWEVRSEPAHFTHSKMMCAIALARAAELAEGGLLPPGRGLRWRSEQARIRAFIAHECWSDEAQSYVRATTDDTVDAALLLAVVSGYDDPTSPRLVKTVDAVRRELSRGPLVHRYLGDDGVPGEDGAFVACSFWLVEALARQSRLDEATELMEEMLALANDVGLYAEEVDPASGEFLGNFPQALSHLALVNAAVAIEEAAR